MIEFKQIERLNFTKNLLQTSFNMDKNIFNPKLGYNFPDTYPKILLDVDRKLDRHGAYLTEFDEHLKIEIIRLCKLTLC